MTLQQAMYQIFDSKLRSYGTKPVPPDVIVSDLKMEIWRVLFYNQLGNLKLKREVR